MITLLHDDVQTEGKLHSLPTLGPYKLQGDHHLWWQTGGVMGPPETDELSDHVSVRIFQLIVRQVLVLHIRNLKTH